VIVGNHKPVLQNVDEAVRGRVNMIPFTHTPPVPDRDLDEKLRAEWPAILAWAIAGTADWLTNGLIRPAVVVAATDEYFSEQDLANRWIEECCDRGDRRVFDTAANLFASWKDYAIANGEFPKTAKWLAEVLKRRGAEPVKDTPGHRNKRGFLRISVRLVNTSGQWQNTVP
jgi:putative DNA primase/helicase